jgi:hypothetical protein
MMNAMPERQVAEGQFNGTCCRNTETRQQILEKQKRFRREVTRLVDALKLASDLLTRITHLSWRQEAVGQRANVGGC